MHPPLTPIVILLSLLASTAHAQLRPVVADHRADRFEFGISIGAWNLNGSGSLWSGRVGRRVNDWLSSEITFDGGRSDTLSPRYRMATAGLRVSAPASGGVANDRIFVSFGAAAATGLSYRVSPFAGIGWQSAPAAGRLATRVELQSFTSGSGLRDKARVLVGFAVALP
jgi:hypothetical protein